jgi:hypothetical protein
MGVGFEAERQEKQKQFRRNIVKLFSVQLNTARNEYVGREEGGGGLHFD